MDGSERLPGPKPRVDRTPAEHGIEPDRKIKDAAKSPPTVPGPDESIAAGLAVRKDPAADGGAHLASAFAAKERAKYDKELRGDQPVTAASYAALTGITVDAAEAARLDALVKKVAARLGVEHAVGFRTEAKYLGWGYEFAFLGMVDGWDRKGGQPIFVGLGLKAATFEDVDLLYRFDSRGKGVPLGVKKMVEDYLRLTEEQRIESILVHEKLELESGREGASSPHRSAISKAPDTEYRVSERVRQHLALYRRLEEQMNGETCR
jgi:hypothetical protein